MRFFALFLSFFLPALLVAKTEKFRATYVADPSTTIVIGWHQVSGENPILYYDLKDGNLVAEKYAFNVKPVVKIGKSMNNHFAHLSNLKPNTTYFFFIKDSEGNSRKLQFQTLPNTPESRLAIAAGGDSRNMREARTRANKLVGKLRPHFVMFGGDMTDEDSDNEWREWLDDWQHTITPEGRLTPILVCRGNHEESNASLVEIFGINAQKIYYALTFGGSLLRVYTLNSFEAPGGEQKKWLHQDLIDNDDVLFKIAQYHLPMRPHVLGKESNQEEYTHWASLFGKHKMRLAVECDAHVVKYTYPLRPSFTPDAVEGFVRDDAFGTVYIGEGCWGAPLRQANRKRNWTRAADVFNQFHWLFVDKNKIEVRTVKTDCADKVTASATKNQFEIPTGLDIWKPATGEVLTITQHNQNAPAITVNAETSENFDLLPKLVIEAGATGVKVNFSCQEMADVKFKLLNIRLGEVAEANFPKQPVGQSTQFFKLDKLPPGRYVLVVRTTKKPLARYLVIKK
jgi:acid phosphatase type 7